MKISKLFHWLYCAVMFLPLFVLPIFALAVRSDNNYQPINLDVSVGKVVDFNQRIINGNFDFGSNNWNKHSASFSIDDNVCTVVVDNVSDPYFEQIMTLQANHYYYFSADVQALTGNWYLRFYYDNSSNNMPVPTGRFISSTRENVGGIIFNTLDGQSNRIRLSCAYNIQLGDTCTIENVQLFDLTQMFGDEAIGVSINSFRNWFPSDFYQYTLSYDYYIPNYSSITFNDTDFGSQTIYTLYKEVDEYFNYDDVLSIGELYEWCNVNLFNGNATLGFFIFFHLLEYWLLTSLLWLIFDILMYVPQLCHRWLDKASLE